MNPQQEFGAMLKRIREQQELGTPAQMARKIGRGADSYRVREWEKGERILRMYHESIAREYGVPIFEIAKAQRHSSDYRAPKGPFPEFLTRSESLALELLLIINQNDTKVSEEKWEEFRAKSKEAIVEIASKLKAA